MVRLDRDNTDPAYLCGRLLAVLEKAQRDALGEVNASVTDRFFGTASAAPASAFGTLMRGVRSHLAKLERDKRGAYFAREEELEEIISRMPSAGFPPTLTPREQGIFSIGYYHQRAFTRAQIQARRTAERQSGDATDTEEENMK